VANFLTYADLLTDVLDRVGELDSASGDYYTTVGRQVVRAYFAILNTHPFLCTRAATPQAIRTIAAVDVTVSLTAESATATLSAVSATSYAGRKLKVGQDWYRITAHTAGTATLTLDAEALADATSEAGVVFQDEYDLEADTRHIVEAFDARTGAAIPQWDEAVLRYEYPVPTAADLPTCFARIGETRIRFSQYPTAARRIELPYTVVPADISADTDGSLIRIPRNFRYVICDEAVYFTYQIRNDVRARDALAIAREGREEMVADDGRKRVQLVATSGPRPRLGA
jgi:hypothetical protein